MTETDRPATRRVAEDLRRNLAAHGSEVKGVDTDEDGTPRITIGRIEVAGTEPETGEMFEGIPSDESFGSRTYLEMGDLLGDALKDLMQEVKRQHAEFSIIGEFEFRIRTLWRREAKVSKGRTKWATANSISTNSREYHAHGYHGIIEVGADYTRANLPTIRRMRALMYHELAHFLVSVTAAGPSLGIRDHEVEAFVSELRLFGPWHSTLERMGDAYRQLELEPETPA